MFSCQHVMVGTLNRPPRTTRRKVGTTSNHHAPYVLGYTRATMAGTKSCETVRWSESHKASLSSDRGLQPAHVKSELLVIVNQNVTVNAFPGLVHTARHTMEVGSARSLCANYL
jgi:hypothetical protein